MGGVEGEQSFVVVGGASSREAYHSFGCFLILRKEGSRSLGREGGVEG